ncbi:MULTISPECIES: lactonase family protein [unclassified Micromonospora]|uniref:lactonase family protein n=1 Tax=unclassified Micromonospora TaxID=2617518 RepID=UPI001033313F|nr:MULTISPECIES: lactonase family protein [unclassified Micromonospora]QKW15949.1 lactonase family protein [Verrucosispora sp. NA02020]TBL33048.1 lactonase family protein [Verrucosispora sp. SN26_14.1]
MAVQGEIVHIGGYTASSGGRATGIVAARRDPHTGDLTSLGTVAVTASPSFLARHPRLPMLYAVNELPTGEISAWRVGADGELDAAGTQPTGGADPCHLAVTPDGGHLVVANYSSGSVTVFPLDADGVPGARTDVVAHQGHGPDPERQEQAHAHMVVPGTDGAPLFAVDLGTDSIYRYDLDAAGALSPRGARVRTAPGVGPRHLARHPDGRRCYVSGELDGSVLTYEVAGDGGLQELGRVEASSRGGHVQPSEIAVGADGRFLYVANRGVGTITVFALGAKLPEQVAEVDTGGEWPRHFVIIGEHLYVADERADMVRIFLLDRETGVPAPLGEPLVVASPTCVLP